MLNVIFLYNIYKVSMIMEDSKYILFVYIGDVTYRMEYTGFQNVFQNCRKIPVQLYTSMPYYNGNAAVVSID